MKSVRDLGARGRSTRLLGRRASPAHPTRRGAAEVHLDHHHRSVQGGGARAAVFGITDGLVSNTCLIMAVAGANPGPAVVRLAGVAGLISGAFSMASGEYVSMKAQRELFQRELELEQYEIEHRPEGERRELVRIYQNRGVEPTVAHRLADEMMRTPELALETHAREELGIDPSALGKPLQAAASSFATFAIGALVPLIPWLFTRGAEAVVASIVLAAVAAFAVGAALAVFTRRSWWRSALRQLVISAAAAAVTFAIGVGIGAGARTVA